MENYVNKILGNTRTKNMLKRRAEEINEKLVAVATRIDEQRCVELEYFVPDTRKSGGMYVTVRGVIKRFDEYERMIVMNDGKKIPIDSIRNVAF